MGAKIYNSNLTKEIIDGAKLQVQDGNIPSEIGNTVVPVMEVNPNMLKKCNILRHGSISNQTTTTLYVTPSDKDFYLCGCSLAMIKDNTSTSGMISINCTPSGSTSLYRPLAIPSLTLTAHNESNSCSINPPILLKRASTITLDSSTNIANITAAATIWGYLIDNINS